MWRVAQFDTLRLRLVKIAARVVEMKTMIRVHLPTSCPSQEILAFRPPAYPAPRRLNHRGRERHPNVKGRAQRAPRLCPS